MTRSPEDLVTNPVTAHAADAAPYQLYGMPASLYTGKARAYLVKQGLPFVDRAPGDPRFLATIVPRIGRWIIPVLEAADGTVIQDGSDIIRHVEERGLARLPAYAPTPRHRVIGQLFELFGGEGLLRPAMHYRWNFDDTNRTFLAQDFGASLAPPGAPDELRAQIFELASQRMRKAMGGFGVSAETIPAIEVAYAQFLRLFDDHLAASPYLLGGRPTLGDYGLIAPLHAHLARDPYPAQLMKSTAHRVWRWVERMQSPGQDAGEYGAPPAELFADDAVPATLTRLLRFVAEDYLPELAAHVTFTNQWLAARPELVTGTSGLPRAQDRVIGKVAISWRGYPMTVAVLPYRLYLLQQVQDLVDASDPTARTAIDALLADTGLAAIVGLRTTRRVERREHLEVWGDHRRV